MNTSANVYSVSSAEFQEKVLQASQQTPVLVDFWAEWCGPCRTLMPLLTQIVESYGGKLKLAKINTEEEGELAAQMGIRSLPTVVMFIDGRPVDQFQGALPEGNIREFIGKYVQSEIDQIRQKARALQDSGDNEAAKDLLRQANQKEPENIEVLLDLANILTAEAQYDQAIEILNALPIAAATRDDVRELKARIEMSQQAGQGPSMEELREQIEANPKDCAAREQLAAKLAMQNDLEGALEQYHQIMLHDRNYNDGAGQKGMVKIFEMLGGEHPLTRSYRRRMYSLMY